MSIVIDIETFGTNSSSVVLSIGAVEIDEEKLGKEFYANIDIDSCLSAGLKVDGRTLIWWMEQSEEARKAICVPGQALYDALYDLNLAFDWRNQEVWCNGLNFDIPILDNAYMAVGLKAPWAYFDCRDYRTFRREMPKWVQEEMTVKPTVAHNALEDAKAQALSLIAMKNWLKRSFDTLSLEAKTKTEA